MKRIPKRFELLGHIYAVKILSARAWEALCEQTDDLHEDEVGVVYPEENLIVLKRQAYSQMYHTFFHELFHAVLYSSGIPFPHDEQYVDQVAGLLAQAISTAR